MKFKTLVRAMSPFTGTKSKPAETEGPNMTTSVDDFSWDLTRVDMVAMLSNFYTIYNPERVKSVSEILHQYEGEEVLMLQQLCERYNLTEGDIQEFLDNAILGKKDKFGNWIRKKSEGSVTFSDADNSSSVNGKKDANPKLDYASFNWDIGTVDLAKALKLLYRTHNPTKTPNIASLENKSEKDKIVLLQQLCKRHNLGKSDMQQFLDKAKSSPSTTSTTSRTGLAKADGSNSITSAQSSKASETAASLLSTLQKQKSTTSTSEEQVKSEGADANIIMGESNLQRTGSLPFWQNRFPSPFSSPTPPPPPPPAAPPAGAGIGAGKPPAPPSPTGASQMLGGLFGGAGSGQRSSPASVAGSVNSSVTAGTGMGTATAAGNKTNASAGRFSSSPAPSLAGGSTASTSKGKKADTQSVASRGSKGTKARSGYADSSDGMDSGLDGESDDLRSEGLSKGSSRRSKAQQGADSASVGGQSTFAADKARAEELVKLQQELSEARLQVAGITKENRALLKALHDSKQRQSDAESTVSGLSSQAAQQEHVPELLLEISKLNNTMKQQEDREQALRRQYVQAKQQIQALQDQCAQLEQQCADARADCKDVLRLVDIMSASPAGIKTVLEAYLKKLGEATGSVPVKFGIGPDGRQIAISERISIALKIKREQDQQAASAAASAGQQGSSGGQSDYEDQGGAPELAGAGVGSKPRAESARSSSAASTGSSMSKRSSTGGKALERQQETYQTFKNKLSNRLRQPGASDGAGGSEQTELDGDGGDGGDQDDTAEDFQEYASPQKNRKSQRPATASAQSNVEEKAGQMQASLASDIATDWVECLDPRSKRKYYYSAALKKSTWVKPGNFVPPIANKASAAAPVLSSMTVSMPSRYASPNVTTGYSGRSSPGPMLDQQTRMTTGELQVQDRGQAGTSTTAARARALLLSPPQQAPSSAAGRRMGGADDIDQQYQQMQMQQSQSPMRSSSPFSTTSLTSTASADYSGVFTTKKGISGTSLHGGPASASPGSGSQHSLRNTSPAPSLSASRAGTNSSPAGARTGASAGAGDAWVTAVDPKSNRKYWYNRNTKVSTWRQPAELIV